MAYASTLRAAAAPVRSPAAPSPLRMLAVLWHGFACALVDQRRRRAMRELRRHQAFGPLINVKHIGLTRDELMP